MSVRYCWYSVASQCGSGNLFFFSFLLFKMSFRYTNNLTLVLRQRLLLEAAHRQIARRTYRGVCEGIAVTCSGFGAVTAITFEEPKSREEKEQRDAYYYTTTEAVASSSGAERTDPSTSPPPQSTLRLDRVAKSIRAATWLAQQQRRAAMSHAMDRSLSTSSSVHSHEDSAARLQRWRPQMWPTLRPSRHLTLSTATPWMVAVMYGLPAGRRDALQGKWGEVQATLPTATDSVLASVLRVEDTSPDAIPIGSLHPLQTPALMQLEDAAGCVGTGSSVDVGALRCAQRRELCHDEEKFWDRVELVRRGQMGTVPIGTQRGQDEKRGYKEMAPVTEALEDRVEFRFSG